MILKLLPEQFGYQIMKKRKILRISQRELASKIGTSQATITRIEQGQGNPTLKLLQRIINALDLRVHISTQPETDPKQNPTWMDR